MSLKIFISKNIGEFLNFAEFQKSILSTCGSVSSTNGHLMALKTSNIYLFKDISHFYFNQFEIYL